MDLTKKDHEAAGVGALDMTLRADHTICLERVLLKFAPHDSGATLFHCRHQDHTNEGFAGLIVYA